MATMLRGDDHRVGFVELFYDLVFVFAITQISHFLLHHFTLKGAAEATILFLAIWWVWIYTTWVLNRLNPDRTAVRLLLFGLMIAGLFVSMAIPEAFGERGLIFAAAYVAMQIGRTLFMYVVLAEDARTRATYLRIMIWLAAAAVFWIAGGQADGETRLWFWVIALAIEYVGPAAAFYVPGLGRDVTSNWTVKGAHMAERCGLFVIICLGETLLVSGATFAEMAWTASGMAAFLASVLTSIGMWWVYFHIGHRRAAHQIETSDDPGRIARLSFTYAHIPIVAGIVLSAVGAERAIAHPFDPGGAGDLAVLIGGQALFLAGNLWFKRLSAKWIPLSHLAGLALTGALWIAGAGLPLWVTGLLAAGIIGVVAIWEDRSLGGTVAHAE
jgi:low temperature requirement protein LtrA